MMEKYLLISEADFDRVRRDQLDSNAPQVLRRLKECATPAPTGLRRPISEIGEVDPEDLCVFWKGKECSGTHTVGSVRHEIYWQDDAKSAGYTHFCEILSAPTEPGKAPSKPVTTGSDSEDLPGEEEPDPLVEGFMAAATALAAEEDLPADWRSEAEEQRRRDRRGDRDNIMH